MVFTINNLYKRRILDGKGWILKSKRTIRRHYIQLKLIDGVENMRFKTRVFAEDDFGEGSGDTK